MLGGMGRGGQVHSHNFRLLAPQRATQLGRVSQRNLARGLHVRGIHLACDPVHGLAAEAIRQPDQRRGGRSSGAVCPIGHGAPMNSESPRQARAVATEPGLHQVRHIRRECRLRQVLGQRLHGHHESSQHERGKGVPLRKRCGFATPNPAVHFPQPNGAPWADSVPLMPHQRTVVLPTTRAPIFKRTTVRWTCLQRREQPDEGAINWAGSLMPLLQTFGTPRSRSPNNPQG